jgi:hypothetical protein
MAKDDGKPQLSSYTGSITRPQWWLRIQALGTPISPGSLESNGEICLSIQRIDGMLMPRYAAWTSMPLGLFVLPPADEFIDRKKKLVIGSFTQSTSTNPVAVSRMPIPVR